MMDGVCWNVEGVFNPNITVLLHEEVHFFLVLNNQADLMTGLTIHDQNRHLSHLVMACSIGDHD